MAHGHDPRDIDDYAWRDVEAFLIMFPYITHPTGLGGFP